MKIDKKYMSNTGAYTVNYYLARRRVKEVSKSNKISKQRKFNVENT